MRLYLDCFPCLLKQTLAITRMAGLHDEEQARIMKKMLILLKDIDPATTAPEIAAMLYEMVREEEGVSDATLFDPYRELKDTSNDVAESFVEEIRGHIAGHSTPLKEAFKVAACANIIDYGVYHAEALDVHESIRAFTGRTFEADDYDEFTLRAKTAGTLLYLGDNAGEIVFDKLLITFLRDAYPNLAVTYAVRGAPVINDVTMREANAVGMADVATVIENGTGIPGTVLAKTSDAFRACFTNADLIISKGQGNFETLSAVENDALYFLFMVKCEMVAAHTNYPASSLLFKQATRLNR